MHDTLLLTPGPLTTSQRTRAAMQRDWGSRNRDFLELSDGIRSRLPAMAGVAGSHDAILLQGCASFAMEAALQTLVPHGGRLLALVNGAYGRRIEEMARRISLDAVALTVAEDEAISADAVERMLAGDPTITDVALVHCETTSGLLNPLEPIARVVAAAGRRLLVDAISAFGAVPIDGREAPFSALVGSANKGLEGVPGLSFVLAEIRHLGTCRGNARSLGLDLYDQWQGFLGNGQWRFTPPVQVVAALAEALDQVEEEGGLTARHARYRRNCDVLLEGMCGLGFTPFLRSELQAPVIATFRIPPGGWFDFTQLFDYLQARGIVIYPGKLTGEQSFRIGCIGAIDAGEMRRAVREIASFVARHRPPQAA